MIDAFVQPGAAKDAVVGLHGAAIKVKIKAPPVDGRANKALEVFFAKLLGVPTARVAVVSGHSSRHKRVAVGGSSAESVAIAVTPLVSSRRHESGQETNP